ncbi:MAG: arsenate reductase ArsC [Magnetococcales bacterium]|nr:arsenate reductase ArsC [Magnetococcales bacterium]
MSKKKILFLCTGNSCRSQMGEGWARHFWGDTYDIYSAGTERHGMNERAIAVMAEAGVDISAHESKTVDMLGVERFDVVFTVCGHAHEHCPYFPGGQIIHVGFEDPPKLTAEMSDEEEILAVYRRVRDEIKAFTQVMDRSITS